jgi:hypothetical protein
VDAHLGDSFAHRFTIAEIAMLGRPDTMDYPGATHFVFQAGEPSIEFLGALKGVHAPHCIRRDTQVQS